MGLKDPLNWKYNTSLTLTSTINELLMLSNEELQNRVEKILSLYFPNANILGSLKITRDDVLWRDLTRSLKDSEYGNELLRFLKSLDLNEPEQALVKIFIKIHDFPDQKHEFTHLEQETFVELLNKMAQDPQLTEKLSPYRALFIFGEKKLYSDGYLKKITENLHLNLMAGAFSYFLSDMRTAKMERIHSFIQQNDLPSEFKAARQIFFPRLFNNLSPTSRKFLLNLYRQMHTSS